MVSASRYYQNPPFRGAHSGGGGRGVVAGGENEHQYLKERQRSQGKETEGMAGEVGGKQKNMSIKDAK